jgi:dTDP-glucose 4,6-dehydratase
MIKKKILVTGGAGFIGSEFVRQAVGRAQKVVIVDRLTYAGDLNRLKSVSNKIRFYQADIANVKRLENVFAKERPDIVINFAGETHVDRSIEDITNFINTNVVGTSNVVAMARKYKVKKFVHISTDEVYGVKARGQFRETDHPNPQNPYSATKAAADHLILAAVNTHGFPAIIVRPCNVYGPWQHPEKFIPKIISQALLNKKIPIYGKGKQLREWLHVCDCVRAITCILETGEVGEVYNVGSHAEEENIAMAKSILRFMQKPQKLIKLVKDRPGHDFRYFMDSSKVRALGWKPVLTFNEGLIVATLWYKSNFQWMKDQLGIK